MIGDPNPSQKIKICTTIHKYNGKEVLYISPAKQSSKKIKQHQIKCKQSFSVWTLTIFYIQCLFGQNELSSMATHLTPPWRCSDAAAPAARSAAATAGWPLGIRRGREPTSATWRLSQANKIKCFYVWLQKLDKDRKTHFYIICTWKNFTWNNHT